MSANSFSSGYSFVYVPKWAEGIRRDRIRHDGYRYKDLFIDRGKYLDLKEEILSNSDNEIRNMKMWTNMVILKANQFINTTMVKNMRGKILEVCEDQPISLQHLHSVILYCDFSALSTSFTATFRQSEGGEFERDSRKK